MNFSHRVTASKRVWRLALYSERRVRKETVVISRLPANRFTRNFTKSKGLLDLVHLVNLRTFHPATFEKRPREFFRPTLYFEAPVGTRALERARGRKRGGGRVSASNRSILAKLYTVEETSRSITFVKYKEISSMDFRETTV